MKTAQILTHARFARAPVIQARTRGRRPKIVTNIRRYVNQKRFAVWVK